MITKKLDSTISRINCRFLYSLLFGVLVAISLFSVSCSRQITTTKLPDLKPKAINMPEPITSAYKDALKNDQNWLVGLGIAEANFLADAKDLSYSNCQSQIFSHAMGAFNNALTQYGNLANTVNGKSNVETDQVRGVLAQTRGKIQANSTILEIAFEFIPSTSKYRCYTVAVVTKNGRNKLIDQIADDDEIEKLNFNKEEFFNMMRNDSILKKDNEIKQ